jgi:hypothetical protein
MTLNCPPQNAFPGRVHWTRPKAPLHGMLHKAALHPSLAQAAPFKLPSTHPNTTSIKERGA